jgi:hypothetical protein
LTADGNWTPAALVGLTIFHIGNEADELARLTRSQPLSLADREDVREIIRTLNQIVAEQMEDAA